MIRLSEIAEKIGLPQERSFRSLVISAKDGDEAFDPKTFRLIEGKLPYWNIYSPVCPGYWSAEAGKIRFYCKQGILFSDLSAQYKHNAQGPFIEVGTPIIVNNVPTSHNIYYHGSDFKISDGLVKVVAYVGQWQSEPVDIPKSGDGVLLPITIPANALEGVYSAGILYHNSSSTPFEMTSLSTSVEIIDHEVPLLTLNVEIIYEYENDSIVAITGYWVNASVNTQHTQTIVIDGYISASNSKREALSDVGIISLDQLTIPADSDFTDKFYQARFDYPPNPDFVGVNIFNVSTNFSGRVKSILVPIKKTE